jgi:hypothetical protein
MNNNKRRWSDVFLLAFWVYAYQILIWAFRLMRRLETNGRKMTRKDAGSE